MQGVNLQQIAAKLFGQQPQNPLYPPPDPSQGAPSLQSQPATAPPTPAPTPTAPAPQPSSNPTQDTLFGNSGASTPPSPSAGSPRGTIGSAMQNQPQPSAPSNAPIPGAPVVPHRGMLAKILLGVGEALGNPLATHIGEHDRELQQQSAQYQVNQPYLQSQANLAQQEKTGNIAHTAAETGKVQYDIGKEQQTAKANAISQIQTEIKDGSFGDPPAVLSRWRRIAQANPHIGLTDADIQGAIGSSHRMGSNYTLTRDPQTQAPIELVDREGKHYSQSNLPQDPEAQQMWNDASKAAAGKEQVEEGKEKRVAGYAADRQAQAFTNQQTEQGRKAAAQSLAEINDAKNQQSMMEQLTSGKMNPASQTAAMFKMIGLEQPSGTHRIMPAEIEGIEQMGGLSDRLKQKLLNWKQGDRFSPDLIPDLMSTAKILTQNKTKTANDNLESTARIYGYKAPGSDAKGRFDKPGDYQQQAAPAPAAGGAQHVPGGKAQGLQEGATGTGSDGKKYVVKGGVWAPAQ